jgi:O-antigen ligase
MKAELNRRLSFQTTSGELQATAEAVKSEPESRHRDAVDQAIFWAFVGGLAWCPFLFGSNVLVAWGINAVLFPGLAAIYELSILVRQQRHPVGFKRLKLSAALFAGVVLWIVVQNATSTPPSLHHPIWGMAAEALDRPVAGSISVNRDLTTLALLRLITAASVLWIALQLCRDASRAHLLIKAIAVIVCVYAAYGLISFAVAPGYVLWLESLYSRGSVSSTFINHNSFATYAGIGLVAICGLILRLYRHEVATGIGSFKFRMASLIEATGRRGALLIGGAFVILVALLLTGSRGGIVATGLGLFVHGLLTFGRRKRGSREQGETLVFVALLVAAAFLVFGDVFVGKIATGGLSDDNRLAVYAITLRSIMDTPVLGYGYGTFVDIFPMFRDRSIGVMGRWEMAHNTYLEVFQGLGLVFGTMLVGSVVLLVVRCTKGAALRHESATIPCVAASAAFLVGAHALVDFSLQMQAIALTFMALLGAGVAQSESSRLALSD